MAPYYAKKVVVRSREDYPERNDKDWLKRTIMQWLDSEKTMPDVSYEELDINEMEMPPGFRGYGKDMTIHHPQTSLKQQAIDNIREQSEQKDRFEIQEQIMSYKKLLPQKYRSKNERLNERFDTSNGESKL